MLSYNCCLQALTDLGLYDDALSGFSCGQNLAYCDIHCCLQALKEFDLYDDTHRLRITVSNMKNGNSRKKLEEIKTAVLKGLNNIAAAPGAQFAPVPPRHQIVSLPTSGPPTSGPPPRPPIPPLLRDPASLHKASLNLHDDINI